jgi:predicted nucleotidyltransferase
MTLIDKHTGEIRKLCSQYKVRKLYAFGSVLTDEFNAGSDVDFIVDFEPQDSSHYADNYFNLKFALEDTLNRKIDLLEEKAIKNPYFKQAIQNQRQLLYGA